MLTSNFKNGIEIFFKKSASGTCWKFILLLFSLLFIPHLYETFITFALFYDTSIMMAQNNITHGSRVTENNPIGNNMQINALLSCKINWTWNIYCVTTDWNISELICSAIFPKFYLIKNSRLIFFSTVALKDSNIWDIHLKTNYLTKKKWYKRKIITETQ